jgi:PAS domain S-box-containing protein
LRDSELRFRAVFEGAPIGISVTSLEGRLVETNRALQEMYGYTGQEFYNLHIVDFTYPDDINPDADLFLNQFVPGKIDHYQLEKRYFRKDGEVFWGRLSMSLARDQEGQPAFAIATTEDITEQKRAQQELQEAYATLEERVEERTRELASLLEVSHRLTSTLNLDVLLDLILEELKLLIDYHGCALYTVEGDKLVARAHRGELPFEDLSMLTFSVYNPLDRLVLERQQAVILEDTWEDSLESRAFHASNKDLDKSLYEHIRSWMAVPLMMKDQVIGEIAFEHTLPNFFTPQHAGFALAVANQAAVMIENARLYTQAQEAATLEERSRLARELHDSVTQSLYSVTLYAEAAARLLDNGDHYGAAGHLRELRDTAQEALREMRLLIFELRPLALEKSGLADALHGRMEAVEARSGIKTHLRVEGEEKIAFTEKVALYQIAQETLNNVLKHAHAANLWVSLQFNEEYTCLEVADDGLGFDLSLASESGGMGLPGIRERVQGLAGNLDIKSAPGKGTRVYITIPRGSGNEGGNRMLRILEKEG